MANNELSKLRILVTNDDGINSTGIKALERIANSITPDVWTVAPSVNHSGRAFSLTFESILRVDELSPRRFAVSGTPADCTYIALGEILKDRPPDLVLSGINNGSNIGDYVSFSGTVGATFAAASAGIKAIAVSQDVGPNEQMTKCPLIEHYLPNIIKKLLGFDWPQDVCMNINFPRGAVGDVCGVRIARQGRMQLRWHVDRRLDPSGSPYFWLHSDFTNRSEFDNSDIQLLEEKKMITITPLLCRHEYLDCMQDLEELFSANV